MSKTSRPPEFSSAVRSWRSSKRGVKAALLHANIRASLGLDLPEVKQSAARPERLAIVNPGPSLRTCLGDVFSHRGPIWTTNSAHDFLIERGLKPQACILLDSQDFDFCRLKFTPVEGVLYYVASQCAPSTFARLKGFDVRMWHALDGGKILLRLLKGKDLLTGGSTVGLRSINLAYYFGFRKIDVFGLDGSAAPGGLRTTDDEDARCQNVKKLRPYWVRGRVFDAIPSYALQAVQLARLLEIAPKDLDVTLHGDGLIQHYLGVQHAN